VAGRSPAAEARFVRRTATMLRNVIVGTVLGPLVFAATVVAQSRHPACSARAPDSAAIRRAADSVVHPSLRPAHVDYVEAYRLRSSMGCVTAIAAGEEPHGFGAVLIFDSTAQLLTALPYDAPHDLRAAGRGRVAFTTRAGGAGVAVGSLVVACSFGLRYWRECLSVPIRFWWSDHEHAAGWDAHYERDESDQVAVTESTVVVVRHGTWALTSEVQAGQKVIKSGRIPSDTLVYRLP
jgi:hypothetical protein